MLSDLPPEPLVAADVDLRGMPWMPLDTQRLLDSDLFALATAEEFRAAVVLWCKAWQQVPAGSLPSDDRVLSHLSGTGARWPKVKAMATRGFVLCADGRLYHELLAEKALEAWDRREAFSGSNSNKTARQQRWRERQKSLSEALRALGLTPPVGASLNTLQRLLVDAQSSTASSTGDGTETRERCLRQGQGQGQGQGQKEKEHTPRDKRAAAVVKPDDVSDAVWTDFLAIRKAKRAPLTATALQGLAREAEKAGMPIADVLAMCCERGWQGFRAEWATGTSGGKPIDVARLVAELEAEEAARATH